MSCDAVDDCEGAEDTIAGLRDALHSVVRLHDDELASNVAVAVGRRFAVWAKARAELDRSASYCRATCGFLFYGECSSGDGCGCPCEHETACDNDPDGVHYVGCGCD